MLYEDHEWVSRYRPPTKSPWGGRGGGRFHERFVCDDLRQPLEAAEEGQHFGLIGFACDEGVRRNHGRPGAAEGPAAFRQALATLPANVPKSWKFYDVGDITCDDGDLQASQKCLGKTVRALREQKILPLVIGGGHEVAWGHYQGLAGDHLSIMNFDAHFDLRPYDGEGSSGTPFLQIADDCRQRGVPFSYSCFGIQPLGNTQPLFDKAHEFGVNFVTADEIETRLPSALSRALGHGDKVYLTVCLDVFNVSSAPGVSAPQPLGLFPAEIIPAIKQVAQSGKVAGFDIAELNPKYDRDGQTAKLAAYLASTFIHNLQGSDS